jgi:hypothetical protein
MNEKDEVWAHFSVDKEDGKRISLYRLIAKKNHSNSLRPVVLLCAGIANIYIVYTQSIELTIYLSIYLSMCLSISFNRNG